MNMWRVARLQNLVSRVRADRAGSRRAFVRWLGSLGLAVIE
jgi:hypothetical protein